ncbi:beta-1,3-galactosyltransferase 1-like [Lineus longissimus]|uniref:beta-1,3-galactosyltransferase 1-like n=1 Tax=Lineus longissimus TaxID=88925 RepID=UPI00315CDABD
MLVLFPKKWRRLLRYLLFVPLIWILAMTLSAHSPNDGENFRRNLKQTTVTKEYSASSGIYEPSGGQGQSKFSVKKPSPTKVRNVDEKERLFYRHSDRVINPHNFTYLINPGKCRTLGTIDSPFLVIMVLANAPDAEKRMTIRKTWGGASVTNNWPLRNISRKVNVYFLHAKTDNRYWENQLKDESAKYGDIIQEDFRESYRNLTLKSIMALKWTSTFCHGASYLMKVDDDVFVNTPYILDLLIAKNPSRHVIGLISPKSRVRRKGKWLTTVEEFPFDHFPPYTPGAGYLMSVPVAKDFYNTSQYVKPIWLEDVYITGILPKILGTVEHFGNDGFTDAMRKAPKLCDVIRGEALTGTRMTQDQLKQMWADMTNASKAIC